MNRNAAEVLQPGTFHVTSYHCIAALAVAVALAMAMAAVVAVATMNYQSVKRKRK